MRDGASAETKRSAHPCPICAKRKVKCDRLIPCTNCVKRGQEKECIEANRKSELETNSYLSFTKILQLWQKYEYWIMDIGLLKTDNTKVADNFVDVSDDLQECKYWMTFLKRDQSFKLLDYSMERLGALYFGCFSDIGELYLLLEEYWQRRDMESGNTEDPPLFSSDDYYSDTLLWSLFTLTVYYMPLKELRKVIPLPLNHQPLSKSIREENDEQKWTEDVKIDIIGAFTECTVSQLYCAKFLSTADVRLVQIYLILANTSFPWTNICLANSMRIICFQISKAFHLNDFKLSMSDSTLLRLTKLNCEKLWYRLCICDYLHSNPNSNICFHTELSSLLQHAAYLEDLPNVDVYQSEQNFEVFFWKIVSLDRDLDQYLTKDIKPPLKTLDAIQRQIEIFNEKHSMEQESNILKSDFEKFLITYLLRMISWKLYKIYFIYHDAANSFDKSIHYAKSLISLIVRNIRQSKKIIFNSHYMVLQSVVRISSFYAFYSLFKQSDAVEELNLDISELISNLPSVFKSKLVNLQYLLSRFSYLRTIWTTVQLKDTSDYLKHPVIEILQNDVDSVSQRFQQFPSLIRNVNSISRKRSFDDHQSNVIEHNSLRQIISRFESQHPIESAIA
ncbi:hypothetical protein HG535_0D01480 [Zygotorulaspora mrakii]|uniref:Zn(2)-C6 fungal-type domain-containing protein n=1 Tax=Zygotorulaspora mrakii TaxID=42260 RepID=A0A7H9B1D7_ZYGMR|nr:uncharacterized protein HG535_0D01480 [Zygotorulaspora mrakii]QLG72440.1 hypothetical protein HG535_0D01480 [Zygotorulaspora mrakii]